MKKKHHIEKIMTQKTEIKRDEAAELAAFEADKKRREEAGVPYKIAEQLARRQVSIDAARKAAKLEKNGKESK